MRFRIHDGNSDDSILVEGKTIEEIRGKAERETSRRGWKDCWSEDWGLANAAEMAGAEVTEVNLY